MATKTAAPPPPTPTLPKKAQTCIICKYTAKLVRVGVRDDPECPVYACGRCYIQFIDPPDVDLREYYRTEYRKVHDFHPSRDLSAEERFKVQRPLMVEAAGRFKKLVPAGASVLEIGCSSGYFLDAIGDGYDRYGAEWNPEDAAYVRDVGELPCEEGNLDEIYPGQTFTAISAIHVLEHQADPVLFLKQCKDRLIGGGFLYLELPSAMEALMSVYDIPEFHAYSYRHPHITYWTKETLASVMGGLGFEAKVTVTQRYGLMNHLNWLYNRVPMDSAQDAQAFLSPVNPKHPLAGVLNRELSKIDKEYRVAMTSYGCGDTIVANGSKREI
jgi:SAM-dependent methyltransferase